MDMTLLPTIKTPADLRALAIDQLPQVAAEIRHAICEQIKKSGGHFAPNLGVVELTIASQLEFIDLVTTLTDNITHMIGFDEESAYWVNMAVRESVANAVEH